MGWETRVDPEFLTDDLRAEMYDPESLAFERHRRLEAESLVPLSDLCDYIHAADLPTRILQDAGSVGVPLISGSELRMLRDDPSRVAELPRLPRERVARTYGQDTLLLTPSLTGQWSVLDVSTVSGLEE